MLERTKNKLSKLMSERKNNLVRTVDNVVKTYFRRNG